MIDKPASPRPSEAGAAPFDAETRLRQEWWVNHGCEPVELYGDDGELQCGRCLVDFKREPIESLSKWIEQRRWQRLGEAMAARPALPATGTGAWQPMENYVAGKTALVRFRLDGHLHDYTLRARYFEAGTLDCDDEVDEAHVDEEGRNKHAGWYELSESHELWAMPISGVPLCWQPLPPAPSTERG